MCVIEFSNVLLSSQCVLAKVCVTNCGGLQTNCLCVTSCSVTIERVLSKLQPEIALGEPECFGSHITSKFEVQTDSPGTDRTRSSI